MRSLALLVPLLLFASSTLAAAAEESAPAGAPERPLYFRLEIGFETTRVIEARLENPAGTDTGYNAVLLDLDEDGIPETRREFGLTTHPRTKRPMRNNRVSIRHEGAIWTLELDPLKSPTTARTLDAGPTSVHWSVQKDGLYVRFLGSSLTLYASEEQARTGAPFCMGPALIFTVTASTRGSSPTVLTDLVGPNGGSLAMVRRDRKEVRPEVRVLAGEESKIFRRPGYS